MTRVERLRAAADLIDLHDLPLRAAEYIEKHGWTQHTSQDDDGRVCLTGALRECAPQRGDFYLARAVYQRRGRAEGWNDAQGRTEGEVLTALRRPITDEDLAGTFGPQWPGVVRLVRRAATLSHEQLDAAARGSAWAAARRAARRAAWDAARDAAQGAAWGAAWRAAQDAVWDAARDAEQGAVWDAARDAAQAVVVRDLITPEQFDTLTGPWVSVLGPTWDEASE